MRREEDALDEHFERRREAVLRGFDLKKGLERRELGRRERPSIGPRPKARRELLSAARLLGGRARRAWKEGAHILDGGGGDIDRRAVVGLDEDRKDRLRLDVVVKAVHLFV